MRNLNLQKRKNLWMLSGSKYQVPGVGTLEIVIILAVLLTIALLFRKQITTFTGNLFTKVFDEGFMETISPAP